MSEDESKGVEETAKALQEVAKTTGKFIELIEDAKPFIGRVLGPPVEDAVGIVSDRLRYYRLKQLFTLRDKVEELHRQRGIESPRPLPPKLAIPLLEAATLEENEPLHDLWARLLATGMDPARPQIQRSFISILQEFEPIDAKLFLFLWDIMFEEDDRVEANRLGDGSFIFEPSELASLVKEGPEECEVSLLNLDRLGCISLGLQHGVKSTNAYAPVEQFHIHLTKLGEAFLSACIHPPMTVTDSG